MTRIFPAEIIALFNRDPELVGYGVVYMNTFCFDYLFVPFCFCINGLFIASGHTTFSLTNNLMSSLILRIPACILFSLVPGVLFCWERFRRARRGRAPRPEG